LEGEPERRKGTRDIARRNENSKALVGNLDLPARGSSDHGYGDVGLRPVGAVFARRGSVKERRDQRHKSAGAFFDCPWVWGPRLRREGASWEVVDKVGGNIHTFADDDDDDGLE